MVVIVMMSMMMMMMMMVVMMMILLKKLLYFNNVIIIIDTLTHFTMLLQIMFGDQGRRDMCHVASDFKVGGWVDK